MESDADDLLVNYCLFDDENKDGPCILIDEEKSQRLGRPCYNIKDFSQIQPHMTMYCALFDDCVISTECFYYCLRCLCQPRDNVLYDDGTIISVSWKKDKKLRYKGFHRKGFNSPIIDVFVNGNPICVRFYKQKVHFTGKLLERDVGKALEIFIAILQETYNFWQLCQDNKELFKESTQWIARYTSTSVNEVLVTNKDGETRIDYRVQWPAYAPAQYSEFVDEIVNRYADIQFVSQLMKRTQDILSCLDPPCKDQCVCLDVNTSLLRYIYDLGFEIKHEEVVNYLREIGYEVTDHDANGSSIKIQLIDKEDYPDDYLIKRKDIHSQNVLFTRRGKIHHSGPGQTRHEVAYKNLMYDIIAMYHS